VLADTGPTGHTIAVAALILAGIAIAVSLVLRPPKTVPAAVWRLVIGLVLMFLLAPATRFGYFIYPASLVLWLEVSRFGLWQAEAEKASSGGGDRQDQRVASAAGSA
jgi:hypothetical protein